MKPIRRIGALAVLLTCLLSTILVTLTSPLLFLNLGDQALAQTDYNAAVEHYERAAGLALVPSWKSQALWGHGLARLKQSRYEEAIADFSAVLSLEPQQVQAYMQRGFAFLQLKQYEQAIADFSAVLGLDPAQLDAYAQRGFAYLQLKQYEQAVADLTRVLGAQPESGDALAQRGLAYLQLDKLDEAIADLQKAVDLKASNQAENKANLAEAYYKRGQIAVARQDYQAALADLSRAIFADATRAEIHTLRGFVNLELGQYADAVDDSTQAIALSPEYLPAYAYRSFALAHRGKWDGAETDATRAIDAGGLEERELALAYFARAFAHNAAQSYEACIADASKALALKSLSRARTATMYVMRGSARLEMEAYAEAVVDFNLAAILEPPAAVRRAIHSGRGWAYLALDNYPKAIEDFTAALRLSPNDPWLYLHRGLAHTRRKAYDQALADYNRAQELDPQWAAVYTNRGVVHAARGEFDQAIADFEKAGTLTENETLRNWNRAHILLTRAAIHAKQAEQATKELGALSARTTSGSRTEQMQRFQANFQAMRRRLQTIRQQVGLMAGQYAEAEKLDLPDWYLTYLSKSRRSLELMVEGFALTEQLWGRTNTLVTVLPKLAEQLEAAASSSRLSQDTFTQYNRHLESRNFGAARQLTAAIRDEAKQYQDYFESARRESGLDFLADAVQFFGKEVEFANAMDQLTDAYAASDRGRFDRAQDQLRQIEAEMNRLGRRMANWDAEFQRWWQRSIQPLANRAEAKFAEAERLGKEAASVFDEGRHRIIIKEPRRHFPPLAEA